MNSGMTEQGQAESSRRARAYGALLAAAVILTALAFHDTARKNQRYLETHPYYGDTASYTLINFEAGLLARQVGRWQAILHELATNERNPFRVIPMLALHPEALVSVNGHLWTAYPAFLSCVLLCGLLAFWRSGSLGMALVAELLPLSAPYLTDPIRGMGANYPDIAASHFLAAAFLSLAGAEGRRRLPGLIAFGMFAALCTLSRWTAAGYVFFVCLPPFLWRVFGDLRTEESPFKTVLKRMVFGLAPVSLLAGWFLHRFSLSNIDFYRANAYGLGHGLFETQVELLRFTGEYFTLWGILCLVGYVTLYLVRGRLALSNWPELLLTLWGLLSFYLLYAVILRSYGDPSSPYHLPALVVASSVAPFSTRLSSHPSSRVLTALIGVFIAVVAILGPRQVWKLRKEVQPIEFQELRFQNEAVDLIISNEPRTRPGSVAAFFFPYCRSFYISYALQTGRELDCNPNLFHKHDATYIYDYKTSDPILIFPAVIRKLERSVDMVFILRSPDAPAARILFVQDDGSMNKAPIPLLQMTYQYFRRSPDKWRSEKVISSPWGEIELFVQISRSAEPDRE